MTENPITHTTPADGNVFEDLGFCAEEAAQLQRESLQRIEQLKQQREASQQSS